MIRILTILIAAGLVFASFSSSARAVVRSTAYQDALDLRDTLWQLRAEAYDMGVPALSQRLDFAVQQAGLYRAAVADGSCQEAMRRFNVVVSIVRPIASDVSALSPAQQIAIQRPLRQVVNRSGSWLFGGRSWLSLSDECSATDAVCESRAFSRMRPGLVRGQSWSAPGSSSANDAGSPDSAGPNDISGGAFDTDHPGVNSGDEMNPDDEFDQGAGNSGEGPSGSQP